MNFYYLGKNAIEAGVSIKDIFEMPVREKIGRAKYTLEEQVDSNLDKIETELKNEIESLISKEVDKNA
jgi:V/A-type H+-transporting ATPase subunit A